ncbi:DUF4270 family protein [Nibribacter ruber]|uniref:DUF4270 family protein n=1 Tax=Nibribacter ruber TaxID=2698458 RepID=A0A6P1NYW7_9BACT|nr:DUF4270 family protein [Nibribacter ruber]QHL88210.1 DUF4270 family protein [Nibribacter ruber]
MNWRINKATAALFLSSLFFASCEDPTGVGLELQEPGSQIGTKYTDTTAVLASTVLLNDSIFTLGASSTLVGQIQDDKFGEITAKTFGEITLVGGNDTIKTGATLDSLVLALDYAYAYGDASYPKEKASLRSNITWNVYPLTQGFIDETTYFTTSSLSYNANSLLATSTFQPMPNDTVPGGTPVLAKFRLDQQTAGRALAESILSKAETSTLKTQKDFAAFFKGLAIVPAGDTKSILGINPTSVNSTFTLYFKNTDGKAKKYTFRFSDRYFNQITADRSGTSLAGFTSYAQLKPSSQTGSATFLQSGTGLVTKLTLPNLENFRKTATGSSLELVVNKAELVIPVLASALPDTSIYALPPVITVVEATSNNLIAKTNGFPNILLAEGTTDPATLTYDRAQKAYVVNVTSYVQSVLYKKRSNNGLILLPSNVSASVSTPTFNGQKVNRAVLEANPYSPSESNTNRRPRLRIFYSTVQ